MAGAGDTQTSGDEKASNLRAIFEILSYIHVDAQRDNYTELAERIDFALNLGTSAGTGGGGSGYLQPDDRWNPVAAYFVDAHALRLGFPRCSCYILAWIKSGKVPGRKDISCV